MQEDERLLTDIFTQLKEEETDDAKRKDLMLFLKELCTFSQTLQPQNREPFFKTLANLGIYSTLEIVLVSRHFRIMLTLHFMAIN